MINTACNKRVCTWTDDRNVFAATVCSSPLNDTLILRSISSAWCLTIVCFSFDNWSICPSIYICNYNTYNLNWPSSVDDHVLCCRLPWNSNGSSTRDFTKIQYGLRIIQIIHVLRILFNSNYHFSILFLAISFFNICFEKFSDQNPGNFILVSYLLHTWFILA